MTAKQIMRKLGIKRATVSTLKMYECPCPMRKSTKHTSCDCQWAKTQRWFEAVDFRKVS